MKNIPQEIWLKGDNIKSQKDWFREVYNMGIKRFGWAFAPDPHIVKFIEKIKKNYLNGGRVLDLGCGQGRHSIFCAEIGFESHGIDYVERAIREANENAENKKLKNLNFRVGDILNLNYPADYFDIIIDSSVLDHVKYTFWKKYKENLIKVLKIGGFLILSEFSADDPRIHEKISIYKHGKKPYPESLYYKSKDHYDHYFHESEIKKMFSDNFNILEMYSAETPVIWTPPRRMMLNALLQRIK